jgi:hypothetical protein
MPIYRDFSFNRSDFNRAQEHIDSNALILGIRNILLSRPGNYPFTPLLGMNIEKYQFDLLDDIQVQTIKTELFGQIEKYLPNLNNVFVDVEIVDDTTDFIEADGRSMLAIRVSSNLNSERITADFLIYKKHEVLNIINETR